nr:hypothetical protein [Tanacetum cinerariifolium]
MVTSSSSSIHDEFQGTRKEGSVTLRYPMLTKTNYSVLAIETRVDLQAQRVWDATQCEGVEERHDRMALAAIYQGIPEDVLLMLADKDTTKKAWETLRTMHMGAERVKEAKVQTLRSDFEVIRMKESESVDEFSMRLNTIVTGIRSLCDTIEEITVRTDEEVLVAEVGDEAGVVDVVVVVVEAIDDEPTLMMEISPENAYGKVFLNVEKVTINLLQTGKSRVESDVWYLDNGASNHMTGDRSKFHELEEYVPGRVKFGDGSTVTIIGKGSVLFDCKNGDQRLLNESRIAKIIYDSYDESYMIS